MFHLFTGQNYYPNAGLGDYVGSFETLDEAEAKGQEAIGPRPENYVGYWFEDDWYEIITEEDGQLVEVTSGYRSRQ